MDRIAQHFFARPDRDRNSRSSRPKDSSSFAEALAKTLAKRAAGRDDERRGRSRTVQTDDLAGVGRFVVEMMGAKDGGRSRGMDDERRGSGRDEERTRESGDDGRARDRGDGDRRRRRRHHGESDDEDSLKAHFDTIRRERRRRRHHSESPPETPRHRSSRHDDHHEPRSSHRPSPPNTLNLRTLKAELEAMSETLTSLNHRTPNHEDCEFYDRF
ncbi:Fc.00g001870.m01.CDS01, partial [Cosmosporella sp. VM-42]